jgi:hypothetical protein
MQSDVGLERLVVGSVATAILLGNGMRSILKENTSCPVAPSVTTSSFPNVADRSAVEPADQEPKELNKATSANLDYASLFVEVELLRLQQVITTGGRLTSYV